MYDATVLADSIAPHGVRLTTMRVVFPRFILAELNTHRMLSRNSASSRAIPPERLIKRVEDEPFVPDTFNRRVRGMGVGTALAQSDQSKARDEWVNAAEDAVNHARRLLELDVDKSRINRLLEPFLWHTAIVTATEWSNLFALRQPMNGRAVPQRDHGAQPEFQIIARRMRNAIEESTPERLNYGEWHLPLLRPAELVAARRAASRSIDEGREWAMISAGRCFTVSYDRDSTSEDACDSYARCVNGTQSGHWSPLEHPAFAATPGDDYKFAGRVDFIGNFRGWCQLRKLFPGEADYQVLLDAVSTGVPEPASKP